MRALQIVEVDNGALILEDDEGTRFSLPIDATLSARIRGAVPLSSAGARKVGPKEIQTQIRSGLSAAEVAELTGAPIEYVERFEGPVLAERTYIVDQARALAVPAVDPDAEPTTFGELIESHIAEAGGEDPVWSSWKDEEGWWLSVAFQVGDDDRAAQWQFDPRRHLLSPHNAEAIRLAQSTPTTDTVIPRLRAVTPVVEEDEAGRFDSGAFHLDSVHESAVAPEREAPVPGSIRTAPPAAIAGNQTSDLLEALRRRRGERAAAPAIDEFEADSGLPELALSGADPADRDLGETGQVPELKRSRNRPAMPSWDEIVFGTKTDE